MSNKLTWKILTIVFVTAVSVFCFTPPSKKVNLGLDLQGGVHFVLKVQTDDALRLETQTISEQVRQQAGDEGITVTVPPPTLTDFTVEGVPSDRDQQFRTIADNLAGTTFDRSQAGAGVYVFKMRPNIAVQTRNEAVTQAIQTIERRVNALGVSEPNIAPYGSANDQIMVELPGVTDVARAQQIISDTAVLELKLVLSGPATTEAELLQANGGTVPADAQVVQGPSEVAGDTSRVFYLVRRIPMVTGRDLRTARASVDEYNQPMVAFTLSSEGVGKFSRATSENVGKRLAIVLDNQVVSAPNIETAITTADARITGRFTQQEVQDLALVLKSGALPASMIYLEKREVGPSLGADSIRAGIISSFVGLGLVTLFMLVYYKLAGFNALASIALNLIILMGFMSYLGAVMTLPGIAGFILTIGMGVDSNVLIFERIKEELAARKTARQAIAASFNRVFMTIVDTHVTSVIAALMLLNFGTGPIRGFAVTLLCGLAANVFTAVFVSRTLFELILSRKPAGATQLSI